MLVAKTFRISTMFACWVFAFALFCQASPSAEAQALKPDETPAPLGTLVNVGKYRVHLYCVGTGDPTVLILGAGPSFAWGLIQPEVAKDTRVCAYDHSGTTWSDDGPADSCALRINEAHVALKQLGVKGPLILVGHSVGGLVARLYAERFPNDVAGIVFVDHAFSIDRPVVPERPVDGDDDTASTHPGPWHRKRSQLQSSSCAGPGASAVGYVPNPLSACTSNKRIDRCWLRGRTEDD